MIMDKETKLKLFKKIISISAAFCILIGFLLLINFWHLKNNEPLKSQTIEVLFKKLSEEPGNEELRKEIRSFDLIARKAYFTSTWQVKTGAYLLLFGGIILAIALKIKTDIQKKIELPDISKEDSSKKGLITHRWLLATGVLVFALALVSAFLSNDYLNNYFPEQIANSDSIKQGEVIEVIPIKEIIGTEKAELDVASDTETKQGTPQAEVINTTQVIKKIKSEDFKKNQSTFRGFLGQGISYSNNIPIDWDGSTGKNIKWKVAVSKPGYNSPVIWGDKIFIAGADKESKIVCCYDRHSGRLLWEKDAENIQGSPAVPPKVTDDTGLSAPTMTVDGNLIFALFATGDIIAFDLDGNRVWAKNLGVPANHYGHSSSLINWNGKLVVLYDTSKGGRMMALNTGTGDFIWDITRDNKISWSSPMLFESKGKMQIITTADPNVASYDLETGKELWKAAVLTGEVAPSPATFNGLIFVSNEYAKTVAVDAEADGKIVWETDEYLSEVPSPVAYDSMLFLATSYGVLVCYDALTGKNLWEKQFDNGFYSSPMIAENKLFIIDMKGIMHILKADKTGSVINEPALGEAAFALPVFADGAIYVRGKNSLFCISTE